MARRTFLTIATIVATALAVACDDGETSDVSVIRSGWFFGQCAVTYCEGEVSITKQTTTFTAYPRSGSVDPPLMVSDATPLAVWRALERDIDTLPDESVVIGCPNCVDEGVEWIEYERSGQFESSVNVLLSCGAILDGAEAIQSQIRAARNRSAATVGLGGVCMGPFP